MDSEFTARRDGLLAMLAEGEAYLRGGGPLDTLKLGQLRWRFSRAVGQYQRLKHRLWFEPMMAAPDACGEGQRLSRECLGRGRELQGFFRRWDAGTIRTDPAGYREAALALIGRTRTCIVDEADFLLSLAPESLVA